VTVKLRIAWKKSQPYTRLCACHRWYFQRWLSRMILRVCPKHHWKTIHNSDCKEITKMQDQRHFLILDLISCVILYPCPLKDGNVNSDMHYNKNLWGKHADYLESALESRFVSALNKVFFISSSILLFGVTAASSRGITVPSNIFLE